MDLADRQKLERIALDRLLASADDEEQWSFVFRTEAAISALYCAWSVAEQWEFDGQIDGLGLQWTPERQKLLKLGEAEPTEEELRQWRKALCRHLADGSRLVFSRMDRAAVDRQEDSGLRTFFSKRRQRSR
jgi:hypothetical protein